MSNPRTDLSIEFKDILEFVRGYTKYDFCQRLYINGSRSPKSKRTAREDSDWDFLCVAAKGKYYVKTGRESGVHADMIIITEDMLQHYSQALEIWPTDQSGLFAELGEDHARD